jgi:HME family heavy-metal exporter
VATVIISGLIISTLLEFSVRPALFWTIGRKAGRHIVEEHHAELELKEAEIQRPEKRRSQADTAETLT